MHVGHLYVCFNDISQETIIIIISIIIIIIIIITIIIIIKIGHKMV